MEGDCMHLVPHAAGDAARRVEDGAEHIMPEEGSASEMSRLLSVKRCEVQREARLRLQG